MKDLTSTSYAVLGLLAIRPSSSYELAKQVARGLRFTWPRAEGRIYDEPKLLVEHGFARVKQEHTGKRPRSVYSITPAGRRALETWLAAPGAALVFEYEALLKVTFAEHATRTELVANLETIRDHAATNLAIGRTMADDHLTNGPRFPERVPLNGLMWNFLWSLHGALHDWAEWALAQVADWPQDLHATAEISARTDELFRAALRTTRGR